jgi:4-hydroxy-3-polyprenylbenzoate decarboxylase
MEAGGLVTKIGFDATAKANDRVEGIDRALPPEAARMAARDWLIANLPPERRAWIK